CRRILTDRCRGCCCAHGFPPELLPRHGEPLRTQSTRRSFYFLRARSVCSVLTVYSLVHSTNFQVLELCTKGWPMTPFKRTTGATSQYSGSTATVPITSPMSWRCRLILSAGLIVPAMRSRIESTSGLLYPPRLTPAP